MQPQISQPKPTASSSALRISRTTADFCGRRGLDWQNLSGGHSSLYLAEVKT
jgi:hypothetical protein